MHMSATATLIAAIMSALTARARPGDLRHPDGKAPMRTLSGYAFTSELRRNMPSVANAAVAVSIRPLVAIAQGISACVRFTGPGRGWMLAERRL